MKLPTIALNIEEFVLRDVPYALRHRIAAAMQLELTRLLSERGLPPSLAQGGHIPNLDIGPVHTADTQADALGSQIAHSVYGKLWAHQRPD